jgi:hypothetical protein
VSAVVGGAQKTGVAKNVLVAMVTVVVSIISLDIKLASIITLVVIIIS